MEKTILLSGINKKHNGVLRLNSEQNFVKINLNVPEENYVLVLNTGEINAYELNCTSYSFLINSSKFSGEITAILCKNENIILYGSSEDKMKAFSLASSYKKLVNSGKITVKKIVKYENKNENNASKKQVEVPQKTQNTIDNEKTKIDKIPANNTKVLSHEKTFFTDNLAGDISKITSENDGISYNGNNFYGSIKSQIDELFECYPKEEKLEKLIKNSSWVRVDYEKNEHYVLGVIKNNNEVKLCYGLPGIYSVKPPKQILPYAKWQPLDYSHIAGSGYWLIFQDGKSGKTLQS